MELSKEDIEFNELLKEKRHKDIMTLLTNILKEITNKEFNIETTTLDISKLEKAIKNINIKQPDLSEIPKSITLLGESIVNKIELIKNDKPKQWIHTIKRDSQGLIKNIISKSKT